MALFQGDLIIKTAIELGLKDIKENLWLLDDIFSDLINNPLLAQKYGAKEIDRAKEFILNNDIAIYMHHRLDKASFPHISIAEGSSSEDGSLATLADSSIGYEQYAPKDIDKPIKFILPPTRVDSYDKTTGIVVLLPNENNKYVREGMAILNLDDNTAFEIIEKTGEDSLRIASESSITGKIAVTPKYIYYTAKRERITTQVQYSIGCHVHGDPSLSIFLYNIVKYLLLRYREGLLEHNGLEISSISSSELMENPSFSVENVYSRFITLSGLAEECWVKTPFRTIEAIDITAEAGALVPSGIKFISKDSVEPYNIEDQLWTTIEDDSEN